MQGIININGYIGSFPGEDGIEVKGIELIDVIAQVQAQQNALSFLVKINSKGGVCSVGYAIHDYLTTLGKPINTEATGYCCSMASIIMMAGQNREAVKPLEFLPHNPWTSGVSGDADDILSAAEEMRAQEDKMIKFYSEATGIQEGAIDAIMKLDKAIPLEKAVELKFLTNIREPLKAVAVIKKEKNNDMNILQEINKKYDAIIKALKGNAATATVFTTTDNKEVEILNQDQTDIAGDPMVGNLVMVGGAPAPDGTYTFEKYSCSVLLGVITEVTPSEASTAAAKKEADEKAEKERLDALAKTADEKLRLENDALKKENAELKEVIVTKFETLEKAVGTFRSTHVPASEQTIFALKTRKEVEDVKASALKAREKYKK